MSQLHALLIGINEYHPQSGVGSLKGCVNDIMDFAEFLSDTYNQLNPSIIRLFNEKATYHNIIQYFETYLIEAPKAGDTVIFYYSGHGSQLNSAEEFAKFDSHRKDETLVCYDSRLPDGFDIADKELAALISQIPEGVQVIVVLDSCHSGTATRSAIARRFTTGHNEPRSLEQYYNGFYKKMLDQDGKIVIPQREHILLGACKRDESAWETKGKRGAFSTSLLSVLRKVNDVPYDNLFLRVRSYLKRFNDKQTPQFEPVGGFNINDIFITGEQAEATDRQPIDFIETKNHWIIHQGALNGLPTAYDDFKKIKVEIYKKGATEVFKTASIDRVTLKFSELDLEADRDLVLEAEISFMPNPSLLIYLEGEQADIEKFHEFYDPDALIAIVDEKISADYTVKISTAQTTIHKNDTDELIHGAKSLNKESVSYIVEILDIIENWERTFKLQNSATSLPKDAVEVIVYEEKSPTNLIPLKGETLNFYYQKGSDGKFKDIYYRLSVRNNLHVPMYVAVLFMGEDYTVTTISNKQILAETEEEILSEGAIYIEDETVDFDVDYIKAIISTEKIDIYDFYQGESIELGEVLDLITGKGGRPIKRRRRPSEWYTQLIQMNTIRQENEIGEQGLELFDGAISFGAHSSFKAEVGVMSAHTTTRSVDGSGSFTQINEVENCSVFNFGSGTRSTQDKSIIKLDNIQGVDNLAENPLKMTINQPLSKDEFLFPMAFDGEFLVPVGDVEKDEEGKTHITITDLPEDNGEQNEQEAATRSIGRALKLAFMKVKMGKSQESIFMLRKGNFDDDGEFFYDESADIKAEIAKAKKIMLVIHGIIGSTETIAPEMGFYRDYGYDLMLTYDYENLGSQITEMAAELKRQLNLNGINENDGKQLDLVVHSMGGLVSRSMIESMGGHVFVDNLIMFGTPNGGSRFGKIVDYQNFAILGLTIATNVFKPLAASMGGFLMGLKTFKKVSVSLGDMRRDSDFIKGLYENQVGDISTNYYTIAGDMTNYDADGDTKLAKFIDSIMVKTGNIVYKNIRNDIAVATDDIMKIPSSRKVEHYPVDCHHLNYFISDVAMNKYEEILTQINGVSTKPTSSGFEVNEEPTNEEPEPAADTPPSTVNRQPLTVSKSILITGVSTGIGYSCAKQFTISGYIVFGSVRKQADVDRLQQELGENFVPLVFDVTDQTSVDAAVPIVEKHLNGKGLGGLINNAGIALGGILQYQSMEDIQYHFDVNVIGLMRVTKAFLPLLGAQENHPSKVGRILNISSVSGKFAYPFVGAYVGSKHAVEGISNSLRRELLLFGIDVIVIGPGAVKTPIWDKGTEVSQYENTPYGKILKRFSGFMKQSAETGLDVDKVGFRILKIFEKSKPKARYAMIPGNVLTNWILPRWLPTRFIDRVVGKQTGLMKKK